MGAWRVRQKGKTMNHCIVTITAPAGAPAARIARTLVAERLAACVNIVPRISSIYRWKGKVERATESLLIAKTRGALLPRLIKRVQSIHPYEVPEIVAVPISRGAKSYLAWLAAETR
jgi:periplasmic divalent cation tolerance protein